MTNPTIRNDGSKRWLDENGELHRENGPALDSSLLKVWYRHGKRHRIGGPAFKEIGKNCCEEWINDGKLHRLDGPAAITPNSENWYVNGEYIDIQPILERLGISPDWRNWSEEEKFLVRLAL